jgi:DNA-binding MarR family transcriptional regulator
VLSLLDLANHLQRRGEKLAARGGLTTQQWFLLLHIAEDPRFPSGARAGSAEPGVLASGIAEARGVSRANISSLLRGLLSRGLVGQIEDPSDRRRRRLVVTATGRAALAAIEPGRRFANRSLLRGMSPAEREAFLGHLRNCLETIEREREEAYQ